MDMFTGLNNTIVMDVKDYIREQCGSEIATHIEFYINFYEAVLAAYNKYDTFETVDNMESFIEDIECEL